MTGEAPTRPSTKSAKRLRREARLAAALRANLKRRKAPARGDKPENKGSGERKP